MNTVDKSEVSPPVSDSGTDREHVKTLRERIFELEERNAHLEQLQQAMQANLELFNALLLHNRSGIAIASPDRRIVRVVSSVAGYAPTELSGTPVELLLHPDDRSIFIERFRTLLEQRGGTAECEFRLRTKDDTYRWVNCTLTDLLDHSGVQAIVCNYSYMPEKRQQELLRAELDSLAETSRYSIFSKTLDGLILSWNRRAEQTFGYTEAAIVGHKVLELIPEELHGEEEGLRNRVAQGETIRDYPTRRLRRNGKPLGIVLDLKPIRDKDGRVRAILHVSRPAL